MVVWVISRRHLLKGQNRMREETHFTVKWERFPSGQSVLALHQTVFQLTQAFLQAFIFMIRILSCVHKQTSCMCFSSLTLFSCVFSLSSLFNFLSPPLNTDHDRPGSSGG